MARGNFPGYVIFRCAGVEKIEELHITKPNMLCLAAAFDGCEHLKVAEGTFPGHVDFSDSGINKIGRLSIMSANENGIKADFTGCYIHLPEKFLGLEYEMDDDLRRKNLQRVAVSKALNAASDIEI